MDSDGAYRGQGVFAGPPPWNIGEPQPELAALHRGELDPALLVDVVGRHFGGGVGDLHRIGVDGRRPDLVDLPVPRHSIAQLVLVDLVGLGFHLRGTPPWRHQDVVAGARCGRSLHGAQVAVAAVDR
jgi:hypothetical protein